MRYKVIFSPSAEVDLDYYEAFEKRGIVDGIRNFLVFDAHVESKRRKRLAENPLAPWELRIGDFRVFYEIEGDAFIRIVSIGHKDHDKLFIRGERVEI